jgi:RNA polymerase sigma-70 factor (ECF subfamily)
VEAREELAREAGRSAYLYALQLTRAPETARDVAQDSVVRFFRNLDRFQDGRPLEPWLFSIVRNQVRDHARREKVRRHDSLDAWLESGGQRAADPATADPVVMAERHELQGRVWQALSGLSEAHREIVVLRDYHDLPYRQIAEVLSIPEGTVMSRLHAARRRLREALRNDP